jgi:hypothetical protein
MPHIRGSVDIRELQWADPEHIDRLRQAKRRFEVIVGSDLLYDGQFVRPLLVRFRQKLEICLNG